MQWTDCSSWLQVVHVFLPQLSRLLRVTSLRAMKFRERRKNSFPFSSRLLKRQATGIALADLACIQHVQQRGIPLSRFWPSWTSDTSKIASSSLSSGQERKFSLFQCCFFRKESFSSFVWFRKSQNNSQDNSWCQVYLCSVEQVQQNKPQEVSLARQN